MVLNITSIQKGSKFCSDALIPKGWEKEPADQQKRQLVKSFTNCLFRE